MALVGARSVLALFATSVVLVAASAHNITAILSGRHDLAEFSRELTATGLADEINGRNTITVLAVDDAHMAPLKARGLPRETLRHVLSLHVLVDYYDDAKLHSLPGGSADVSTLFQASGDAPGSAGMVEIADRRGGRVAFAPNDAGDARGAAVFYVKSVHQAPYNISVLQVSGVMSSPAAESPASSPESSRLNFSDVMCKNGCGRFAGLIATTDGAASTFDKQTHDQDGFTFFCPADKAVEAFEPTFKKLNAVARLAVVLYHGAFGHYSPQALRADEDDLATLATIDGGNSTADFAVRHAGDKVTLVSATHNKARVTRALADADTVAVYMIDAVLVPFDFTALASAPPDIGPVDDSDGRSGRKDGGDGHRTSGSAPCWPLRGWVALALVFSLLAAFASG
ncbi:Fasciclin-like arabinogalactan protein 2 [Dichanthelium oligosanthes]|uniref:Fasciclin-like arabinogalactan protein 2 n=1 Tax=Dichanthelium oligosanthes TaxID=888268 RepID=A0A1E5V652_9POAL|nr:Fasciclin-like arabinogalactan protein 2 [Dichanthelium oligosanthes]